MIRVGISGWVYKPWTGVFYPDDLPAKEHLAYASRQMAGALEINSTFYRLQSAKIFSSWYEATPSGFRFAVKGSRFITHIRRLREAQLPLANFFAQGLLRLRDKLGPILWQLPPNFRFDHDQIEEFLKILPRTTDDAAQFARQHDQRVSDPYTETDRRRRIQYAMEVRHSSFVTPEFIKLLRKHKVALVVAETADKWPLLGDVTSDFMYLRLHGAQQLYVSGYTDEQIETWARRVRSWSRGASPRDVKKVDSSRRPPASKQRDVYVFFDNTDIKLRAPFDAMALIRELNLATDDKLPPPPKFGEICAGD